MTAVSEEIQCVWEAKASLGEGPLWCPVDRVLYWVDIKGRAVHRYRPRDGNRETFPLEEEIGGLALREGGGTLAALRSGLAFLDLATGEAEFVARPEKDLPGNRFNDCKCDRAGRFWVGSMDAAEKEESGSLYCLSPDLSLKTACSGFIITNGLGWSPDNRTMYFTDTLNRVIHAFDFDLETGGIENRRPFARVAPDAGFPDGLTVDSRGCVWGAHWDGGRITCYDPTGAVEKVIHLPVRRPTSCMFGGDDLDRLYVTSASMGLDGRRLGPLDGGLLEIDVGVKGLPETRFQG